MKMYRPALLDSLKGYNKNQLIKDMIAESTLGTSSLAKYRHKM